MKILYRLIIFFAVIQLVALMLNSLGVFPNTLYSDIELDNLEDRTDQEVYEQFFAVNSDYTFTASLSIFIVVGSGLSILTKSWLPAVYLVMIWSFVFMLSNSKSFFDKILYTWDSTSLAYIGLILGVGILIMVVITAMEVATHGDA